MACLSKKKLSLILTFMLLFIGNPTKTSSQKKLKKPKFLLLNKKDKNLND